VSQHPRQSEEDGRAPIQRRRGASPPEGLESLPSSWLVDFEGGSSAEAIDRLIEDSRLYHALAAQDFEGPNWNRFKDALARYGLQVIGSWIRTGLIFKRCRERGLPTERPVRLQAGERSELAAITVAEAIAAFRDRVLRNGNWDPDRGASLRTYFIGQCLLRFPRVYKNWLRAEKGMDLASLPEDDQITDQGPGPEALAETRLLLASAVAVPAMMKVARVLLLVESGYRQDEIARRLDMSISSIESLLYRHRRKEGA